MSRQNRGFTLLEVLVALAIFATAAIATIRSVSQHINTLNFLEEKTFASMVADNQMTLSLSQKRSQVRKREKKTWQVGIGFGLLSLLQRRMGS